VIFFRTQNSKHASRKKNMSNIAGNIRSNSISSAISSSNYAANTSVNTGPILASLDIGSTSVKLVMSNVVTINQEQKIEVVGVGVSPNSGLKQGVVVNIESTTECIRKAKEEAELMSGSRVTEVWVSVSGSHVQSFDSRGMVAIKNKEVTNSDIDRVIEAAKAIQVPADRTVLHVIPREFKIDHQDGITDPIGMSGVRLEANVHIVTASQSAVSNLIRCIEKAGLKVAGLVLDQVAVIKSVLSADEKNLGVCLADIGGGATKLVYILNGSVAYTSIIPLGGSHFTQDAAVGLRTPQIFAETLKKKYGCALASLVGDDESIEVEGVGGRKARSVQRKELAHILEARAEECLTMIANNIRVSGLQPLLGSGIVITGGASQLDGLVEMGEFIFDSPIRRGFPVIVGGLKDVVKGCEFSTAIGLLMFALESKKDFYAAKDSSMNLNMTNVMGESIGEVATKMKKFFTDLF
jgi:cell division protein FtsA